MDKREIIYNGESVKIFGTEDPGKVLVCFTDNITAFNKIKRAVIADKGRMNCAIATMIYKILKDNGIDSHFIRRSSPTEQVCRRVSNIPVEVIVRNVIAGSMAARLGLKEGLKPAAPIFDLCYKNEDLCDPIINDYHAIALGLLTEDELKEIYRQTKRINEILVPVFKNAGIDLIDFKIEFGRLPEGGIILADEINPDNARFWDCQTRERLDKDRFRRDMGKVGDAYRTVYERLAAQGYNEAIEGEE